MKLQVLSEREASAIVLAVNGTLYHLLLQSACVLCCRFCKIPLSAARPARPYAYVGLRELS